MRRVQLAFTCTLLLVAAAPTPAVAQRCQAPPGTAAVEQYCETVPEVTGNRATGGSAGVTQSRPGRVSPETLRTLERAGEQGQELGAYLQAGAPAVPAPRRSREGAGSPAREPGAPQRARPEPTAPPGPDLNPLRAVGAALAGGETVSRSFPWLLLLIAVAIGGAGWLRPERRERG